MVASSLAPHEYSPNRETPWMAVGLIGLAAVFGLWKGFATQITAEHVGAITAPAADTYSPRAATALPAVAASTDTLIPPEAQTVAPMTTTTAVAPVAKSSAAPVQAVPTPEPQPAPAALTPDNSRLGPTPSLQVVDEEPSPPPEEEEPPPEDFDPYY